MSPHIVHCQDIGSNIQIRHRVRPGLHLRLQRQHASTPTSDVGSKSLRPKKGMLSSSPKPAELFEYFCYNSMYLL